MNLRGWRAGVFVSDSFQRRGYGHRLANDLLKWLDQQSSVDDFSCSTDSEAGDRFAASFGFEVREQRYVSTLDPITVDLGQFAELEAAVRAQGVRLTTLAGVVDASSGAGADRSIGNIEHQLYLLDTAAMADEPGQLESTPVSFDVWRV